MDASRPHTPVNLITPSSPSEPINIGAPSSTFNRLLGSPMEPNTSHMATPPAIEPSQETNESIENVISGLLVVLDQHKPIDVEKLRSILQKCLISLSHYKLQAEIMKFNQLESSKRNEIENKLIQTQVDYLLLQSPFSGSNDYKKTTAVDTLSSRSKSSPISKNGYKVYKPAKVKLVEKVLDHNLRQDYRVNSNSNVSKNSSRNSYKNSNEFNNCIKVFHLERNT